MQQEAIKRTSVVARYAEITDPSEFEQEIDKGWKACSSLRETLTELVRDDVLTPVQAAGILSCSFGQVFGYNEFHGQWSPWLASGGNSRS